MAGLRRVVARLADDESAASIIGYYCGLLAPLEHEGLQPTYSETPCDAKRWARTQEKWRHPFYWAMFLLVGPN